MADPNDVVGAKADIASAACNNFAGIWRPWTGKRGTKTDPVEGRHRLYAFLTCASNEVVKPIHAKAMPVLLTTTDEAEQWLTAPVGTAKNFPKVNWSEF